MCKLWNLLCCNILKKLNIINFDKYKDHSEPHHREGANNRFLSPAPLECLGWGVCFFFFLLFTIKSFSNIDKDSVVKIFPEISVEASKIIIDYEQFFNSTSFLTKSNIQETGTWQVSQVLENQPGLFIKDYGGLGGLKTISTRGTNSSQTLILLDGMRINSNQNGSLDLSVIPAGLLNRIEIIRSGSSGLFGGNAIGGIISLNTLNFDSENRLDRKSTRLNSSH